MQPNEPEPTFGRILRVVRRRGPLVLICVIVAVAAALAYSLHAQKEYTSTASLLFNNTPVSQQVAGLAPVVNTAQQSQQDTNTQLLKLGDLALRTADEVGHGLTQHSVSDSVAVSPQGDTTLVNVAATMASPSLAARVATTYANVFVNEQENANHQYYSAALDTVERQIASLTPSQAQGAQGLALENRAQSLATLAQLRSNSVQLAQAATVPTSASSPRTVRNVTVAALLGLLFGVALALTLERFDQRIRDPDELERTYGLSLLGAIPESRSLRRTRRGQSPGSQSALVADTFQFVRTRLRYFNVDRDLRTVAIVSSLPGDGKTTVAHWLANATAAVGSRALLIETDLRRPTLAEEVHVNSGPGLADVLIGARAFEEVIQRVSLIHAGPDRGSERGFDVIVAGALPPNPAEMLESKAMAALLDHAKSSYDLVVLDTSPLGPVSDALPLLRHVDGVAIVAAMSLSRRDVARRLKETLTSVDASLLGVVANRVKGRGAEGYGYGYNSYTGATPQTPEPTTGDSNGRVPAESVDDSVEVGVPKSRQ